MEYDEGTAMVEFGEQVLLHHQKQLPDDLIRHHILPKLPIKSLVQFKLVSKQWYSTLSSHQFALFYSELSPPFHPSSPIQFLFIQNRKKYYIFSHYDDVELDEIDINNNKNLVKLGFDFDQELESGEELHLIGTCNGLVCLASCLGNFFVLWNPVIGKFRKYFDDELEGYLSIPFRVSWGFGYVSNVDDYKVIRIIELGATLEIRVHVFSLKSNKWTRIVDELYQDIFSLRSLVTDGVSGSLPYSFHSMQGVLVNETLYWIVSKVNDWGKQVVSFDLVCEEFRIVLNMSFDSNSMCEDRFLCVMGGCLSKFGVNLRNDVSVIRMLKYPGMIETICLSSNFNLKFCENIVGFTRTGKFFFVLRKSTFGLVDPNSKPVKYTRLARFDSLGGSRIASYVPSLTLPYTTNEL